MRRNKDSLFLNRSASLSTAPRVTPTPDDPRLTTTVAGVDQDGAEITTPVVTEKALTLFLNDQEVVTLMTIGDRPEELGLGYLLNQNMLRADDEVTAVEHDDDLDVIVVRTERATNYEEKLRKRVQTSGCAQGTLFGDVMERFDDVRLDPGARLRTSWVVPLTKAINTTPSLYLKAGAIHGCALCRGPDVLAYFEDVGRHNAVDKVAGWMWRHGVSGHDKLFYTTGRLTSEMVIKTVQMGIPILVSRSGFTASGVQLAQRANLTLVGRARGRRFVALAGLERLVFDEDRERAPGENRERAPGEDRERAPADDGEDVRHRRKASLPDEAAGP